MVSVRARTLLEEEAAAVVLLLGVDLFLLGVDLLPLGADQSQLGAALFLVEVVQSLLVVHLELVVDLLALGLAQEQEQARE